jgi:hypothetical protein
MPLSRITSASIANSAISAADIADGTITAVKIISVANTQITGNIVSSQITSVANTQISGNIIGSQISSNTLSNTVFQTGSVENYMSAAGLGFGMRNRIINGAMVIDQRNAGASVTPADGAYTLDRWSTIMTTASKFTIQQNAGSVSTLANGGFTNYLGITSSSSYSVLAGDIFGIHQRIEGFNTSDLLWGTANAKTVTLSFQVYSSLTGTFGGSLINSAANRSYPFTYSIPTANTWTTVSLTIAGDTSGTWIGATNGFGIQVNFGVGGGSTYSGTAGAWASQQKYTATGATSVVGTNGATFYITGVQLEKGSTATSFDYRPYGTELMFCQRYYVEMPNISGTSTGVGRVIGTVNSASGNPIVGNLYLPVPMRAAPGVTAYGGGKSGSGSISTYSGGSGTQVTYNTNISGLTVPFISANMFALNLASIGSTQSGYSTWTDIGWSSSQLAFVANAEL